MDAEKKDKITADIADEEYSQNVYDGTSESLHHLLEQFPYYRKVMDLFREGTGNVELRKRYMLKMIDEEWVKIIEDTLPSLDVIIRNPGRLLCETEELLPVEQTKRVTGRSVVHLSQHTDLINEIKADGTVMPSKLLNVFQDDTILTYENRFINTLIARLFAFVSVRVDAAEECGTDEKLSTLTFSQTFEEDERRGKISLQIEMSEQPREHEVVKNYIYSSDLWKRVLRIRKLVTSYMDSNFVHQVGRNYVRPPIMRTNMLLKNVDFRQCLTLWEFLETYENTGYETLIQEDVEKVEDGCSQDFYKTLAEQYVLFQKHVRNSFEPQNATDVRGPDDVIHPQIKTELDPFNPREYDYKVTLPDGETEMDDETANQLEQAVLIALAADDVIVAEEQDFEEEAEMKDGKIIYRYRYSFLSRLILAQNPTQNFYNEIKNYLLSFSKVKSRVSWNHDAFSAGRKKCARINVKGKTVFLYLPVLADSVDKKYRLAESDLKNNGGYPSLLRVRSDRGVKYAKELIDVVMQNLGLEKLAEPVIADYHLPFATKEEMASWKPQLVKIIGETGETSAADELETNAEDAVTEVSEKLEELLDSGINYRYRYSFQARLIQSNEVTQGFYGEIKNYLLSFSKVKSVLSWGHESFRFGRNTVARVKIRGKSVMLYLALSPQLYVGTKFRLKDLTADGKTPLLPAVLKVRSARGVKHAKQLIDNVMKNVGAVQGEIPQTNYRCEYRTTEQLLAMENPLVKSVGGKRKQHVTPKDDRGDK